jgi:hypothetical protein
MALRLFHKEYVDKINKYGGKLKDSIGIPEETVARSRPVGSLQNQYRLGWSSCHDCCHS